MSAPQLVVSVFWGAVDDPQQVQRWLDYEARAAEAGFRRVRRIDDRKAILETADADDAKHAHTVVRLLMPDATIEIVPNTWNLW